MGPPMYASICPATKVGANKRSKDKERQRKTDRPTDRLIVLSPSLVADQKENWDRKRNFCLLLPGRSKGPFSSPSFLQGRKYFSEKRWEMLLGQPSGLIALGESNQDFSCLTFWPSARAYSVDFFPFHTLVAVDVFVGAFVRQ